MSVYHINFVSADCQNSVIVPVASCAHKKLFRFIGMFLCKCDS
jgi:hypothetical protein